MNFTLLGNIIKTELALPFKIEEGYFLDKANNEEIDKIKKTFSKQLTEYFNLPGFNPFENTRKNNSIINLEKESLNYWVLRHDLPNTVSYDTDIFNLLLPDSIYPIATIFTEDGLSGFSWTGNTRNILRQLSTSFEVSKLENSSIEMFKNIKEKRQKLDKEKHKFILSSINDFYRLTDIPNHHDLRIIGYFSIIEKLISSRKAIQINSINFQLQNKFYLINNRSKHKIDLLTETNPTDKTTFHKVIELLYKYRSSIAHGSTPDFNDELQILKASHVADKIIERMCKITIVAALEEPDLIIDLREC